MELKELNKGVLELFLEWVKNNKGMPPIKHFDKDLLDNKITIDYVLNEIFDEYGVDNEYSLTEVGDTLVFIKGYNYSLKRAFVNIMIKYDFYDDWALFYDDWYNKELYKVLREHNWKYWETIHKELFNDLKEKWENGVDFFSSGACCHKCHIELEKMRKEEKKKIYFKDMYHFIMDYKELRDHGMLAGMGEAVFITEVAGDKLEEKVGGLITNMVYKGVNKYRLDDYQLFFIYFIEYIENVYGTKEKRKLKLRDINKRIKN